ncbi:hypothetical protein HYPSUDRAFT_208800 [Hypholoma sublateritium FD-334 SS-4]|uniref:Uncharacterized protein n=1 Tax=Hypholoma sublateritium (strain FD-334 SS-4) TaxID=945553 RepID=A0A0D2LTY4_HYPSF|nr:hypothetical protein HYPSUDRAFT_208800 [Hypholoma sublateritium FD-334 SS-4]
MFGGLSVSISSGSSLGKDIFRTPPPSTERGSDRARSDVSDAHYLSTLSGRARSMYCSYTSSTSKGGPRTMTATGATNLRSATSLISATNLTGGPTASASQTHTPSSATLTASYRLSDAGSYRGASDVSFAESPSTLSHTSASDGPMYPVASIRYRILVRPTAQDPDCLGICPGVL